MIVVFFYLFLIVIYSRFKKTFTSCNCGILSSLSTTISIIFYIYKFQFQYGVEIKISPITAIFHQLWPILKIFVASMLLIKMVQFTKNGTPKKKNVNIKLFITRIKFSSRSKILSSRVYRVSSTRPFIYLLYTRDKLNYRSHSKMVRIN